ncbi:MAG TPA: hypothetical protein VH062_04050 [Polyangiaceae bacterium]|nr:hypothetical protein [Polyangiaceae bacterium]
MLEVKPALVSAEMGYGHLRAALPLVEAFGTKLLSADQPPLADESEALLWARVRRIQELLSKPMQLGRLLGNPLGLMDRVTNIPPLHTRGLDEPHLGAHALDFLIRRGLGRGLVRHLKETGVPLVTTFYASAIIADRAGCDSYCVVTDADINRVWAPMDGKKSRIHYFAPSTRVVRRLAAYGVPRSRVTMTGFPLPPELVGGRDLSVLKGDLAARLVRLDPSGFFRELHRDSVERELGSLPASEEGRPPRLVFAVGGAGAQAEMAYQFLPSLRKAIRAGRLELTLIAGIRRDVANTFVRALEHFDLATNVEILTAWSFDDYYRKFNALMRRTDILWTKPSELSFYAGLGLGVVLAKPVGGHERYNRRWLREQGVALKQHSPRHAAEWIDEWLNDGTLAAAAWTGFLRLPKDATNRIVSLVRSRVALDAE